MLSDFKLMPNCPHCHPNKLNQQTYNRITHNGAIADTTEKLDRCARCEITRRCKEDGFKYPQIYEVLANQYRNSIISGTLKINDMPPMVYLKIENSILIEIYNRFVELRNSNADRTAVQLPPYYHEAPNPFFNPIGAHITVIGSFELRNNPDAIKRIPNEFFNRHFPVRFEKFEKIKPIRWQQMEKVWIMTFESEAIKNLRLGVGLPAKFEKHELHATFAVKSKVGSHDELNLPKSKSLEFLLLRLPEFLNDPSHHQKSLTVLFLQLAVKFNLNIKKLDPLLLNDWVKLLAQTLDPDLINLGCVIWKENQTQCQKNIDLLLFQALSLAEPNQALHHFCDMHATREPRLTIEEYVKCLKLITFADKEQSLKIGLKRLTPILFNLTCQENGWTPLVKENFMLILKFLISRLSPEDFDHDLLIRSIAKDLIHPKEIRNDFLDFHFINDSIESNKNSSDIYQCAWIKIGRFLLEQKNNRCLIILDRLINEKEISTELPDVFHLFLVDCLKNLVSIGFRNPKNLYRLNRLIQISPPSNNPDTAKIFIGFLNKFFKKDSAKIAESGLGLIEELAVAHKGIIYKLPDWTNSLLTYLNATPIASERPYLYGLFCCLLHKEKGMKKINEIVLLRTLANMMNRHFPLSLPIAITHFITNQNVSPIVTFRNSKEYEVAQIYIRLNHFHPKLSVKDLIFNIWNVCFELSRSEQPNISTIIKLLEMQEKKSWRQFFTAEKDQKDHAENIPTILNLFFKTNLYQENERFLEWTSFLLLTYLESPFSETASFDPVCPDDNFIEIALKLLSQKTSLVLKEYLLTAKEFQNDRLITAARCEIDAQLNSVEQINLKFCLNLRKKYFPKDEFLLLSLIKSLRFSKDKTLFPIISEEFEKLKSLSSDDLAAGWIALFEYLKRNLDPKIWDFLDRLPEVFSLDTQINAKESAKQILIEGASLKILEIKQLNKTQNFDYFLKLLWNEAKSLQSISSELFLYVFSSADENFIISNLEDCLLLGKKVNTSSYTVDIKRNVILKKLKANFTTLFNQFKIEGNLKLLTNSIDESESTFFVLENFLEFICRMRILNKRDFIHHYLLVKFIIENRYNNLYQYDFLSYTRNVNIFFDLYALFSQLADFKTEEAQKILSLAMNILMQIYSLHFKLMYTIDSNKESSDFVLRDYDLVSTYIKDLLGHAVPKILPNNFDSFTISYLVTIFKLINNNEYEIGLSEIFWDQIIKIMKVKESQKTIKFYKIKTMFEMAIDWKIDATYLNPETAPICFCQINEILLSAGTLKNYKNDKWLFNRLNLVQENESELTNLNNEDREKICVDLINKLIGYNTEIAFKRAVRFFFKYLSFNFIFENELRINLFESLMKVSIDHALIEYDGKSLLSYIHDFGFAKSVFKKLNSILSHPFYNGYFIKILEIEFNTALNCMKSLIDKAKTEDNENCIQWIPHYCKLCLDRLKDLIDERFIKEIDVSHFLRSKAVVDIFVDAATLFMGRQIEQGPKVDGFLPNDAIKLLVGTISLKSKALPDTLKKKQHRLLQHLLNKLIRINTPPGPFFIHEKCDLILLTLLEVIIKSDFARSVLEFTLDPFLKWLEEQELNLSNRLAFDMIKYHFQKFYDEQEQPQFEFFSGKLFTFSRKDDHWLPYFFIIWEKVVIITQKFNKDPQEHYRKIVINFLYLLLESLNKTKPNEMELMGRVIISCLFNMIDTKIVSRGIADCERLIHFAEQTFETFELNIQPIKLAQLILQFDELSMEEKEDALQKIKDPLSKWIIESENRILFQHFIELFQKVPHLYNDFSNSLKTFIESKIKQNSV